MGVFTIPPARFRSRITPSITFAICSFKKFRKYAAVLRRAAIKDKRPTKAAKQREPGIVPSLCPLSKTIERLRTTRLKRAWNAREASIGRDEDVVVIVYGMEWVWDA
jgi:hypothetical protein